MDRPFPAYKGDEPFIFVSYAHANADTVYLDGDDVTYTFPAGTENFARLRVTGP